MVTYVEAQRLHAIEEKKEKKERLERLERLSSHHGHGHHGLHAHGHHADHRASAHNRRSIFNPSGLASAPAPADERAAGAPATSEPSQAAEKQHRSSCISFLSSFTTNGPSRASERISGRRDSDALGPARPSAPAAARLLRRGGACAPPARARANADYSC